MRTISNTLWVQLEYSLWVQPPIILRWLWWCPITVVLKPTHKDVYKKIHYAWFDNALFLHPHLTSYHLPLLDWEPQADVSRPCQSTSWPWSRDHHPVSGPVWLGVSPAPPGQPPIILRQSQHDGFTAISNPGWGCHCSFSQAGFVNSGSLDSLSAPWIS